MSLDPLTIKITAIEKNINALFSEDRKTRLFGAKFLGFTIGTGIDTGLEKKAVEALEQIYMGDKDRRVRKAAKDALIEIQNRLVNP